MSKMTQVVKEAREKKTLKRVENFMGGYSYEINPLDTLKMVTASSIFGEPQYYNDGAFKSKYCVDKLFLEYSVLPVDFKGKDTQTIMEESIDAALDYDFEGVLDWAVTLRKDFFMRLNPQVIMVRAAMHPERAKFNEEHPGKFKNVNMLVMSRADDVISQLTYYLFINKSKNNIPNILKRSWAERLEKMTDYELYKYRNHGIGLIDTVRISHANSESINQLMKTGTVEVPPEKTTWETLRASGKTWIEILDTIKMNHMALLRNLRGIFTEIEDVNLCQKLMDELLAGVKYGKQFPYRYLSAKRAINGEIAHAGMIKDGLEKCMDVACDNLPKLKGRSAFLSDNSGSAWGTLTSEYGSVTVGDIDNLSAVIGAVNSEDGTVFTFGDRLLSFPISKRDGILGQAENISKISKSYGSKGVGASTENGIWLFFDKALKNKEHWDNIFIYSDMQAGHGGLYGINPREYAEFAVKNSSRYIDVAKLIAEYRKKVNPKVNVFCIQTAGYDNVLVPEYGYRTNILYGWTGKELLFADAMNKFWDEKDLQKSNSNK